MGKFWDEYPAIKQDLEDVKAIMKENIKCSQKIIETALQDLIDSGGKLLRPGFVILAARFGKYDAEDICTLGAVVEMLHMATLIHDDIIDNTSSRRGSETVQSKYGKNYAVYMGDFLFSRCFMMLSDKSNMKNMKMLSKAIAEICIGEIDQYSSQYNTDFSSRRYFKRISAKTAELFSMSFYVGAKESKCSYKLTRKLAQVGHYIGMAFQVIDDILDYTGEEKLVGKPLGNDLKEGIYTLPLILAMESGDKRLKELIHNKPYSDDDIRDIIELTKELGGVDKAREIAKRYTQKAYDNIKGLPNKEAKSALLGITEKLLDRNY